jgi:hypothetical protein
MLSEAKHLFGIALIGDEMLHFVQHDNDSQCISKQFAGGV